MWQEELGSVEESHELRLAWVSRPFSFAQGEGSRELSCFNKM
jgi:hypothetical protein